MNFPDSKLWDFSVQTYSLPEVQDICLSLQDDFNANINIIMYCLWTAEQNIKISQDNVTALVQSTQPWQDTILKPLRDVRKMIKDHIIAMPVELLDQTVSNLGEMELNAEHMSQMAIEKIIDLNQASEEISVIECATLNLSLYLKQLESISSVSDFSVPLGQLLSAVYQDAEAVQASLMQVQ